MRLYDYDIKVQYLPVYLALPIMAVLLVISGYLFWWLIHGTWPAILMLMGTLMGTVEVWMKTKNEKQKIIKLRKIDPL